MRDETLNGIDVAGDSSDQITRAILIVKCEREFLDVKVDGPSQVVADPLRDTGREIFFEIAGNGIQQRDPQHRQARKLQENYLVRPSQPAEPVHDRGVTLASAQHIVEHDFQRPRLKQVSEPFPHDSKKPKDQRPDMGFQ